MPTTVGVRELRGNLSNYLSEAQTGHTVIVTDRGVPVAKLVQASDETVIERLVRQGRVLPAEQPKGPAPVPIRVKGTVSDLVDEQRR